jgi:hypothetical protein
MAFIIRMDFRVRFCPTAWYNIPEHDHVPSVAVMGGITEGIPNIASISDIVAQPNLSFNHT